MLRQTDPVRDARIRPARIAVVSLGESHKSRPDYALTLPGSRGVARLPRQHMRVAGHNFS
jgi:hypothetical protein